MPAPKEEFFMEENRYSFENPVFKDTYRHTSSHMLAQAMKRLHPEVKLAIGPAIEHGFYYDFDAPFPITSEILEEVETEMRKISKEKLPLERFTLPRDEAIRFAQEQEEPYKVELITDLPEDAEISFYRQGEFVDLCAGPHLDTTGRVKGNAFKLTSATGAYWRGDSSKKMLQRVYGTSFMKKEELEEYLNKIEEAKKRDHRKIGKELGLFLFQDEGPGFPFFLPKGMIVKNKLLEYWRELHTKAGYSEISTPIMLDQELWHRSGHWDNYKNNMYSTVIDEVDYSLKPMNCPGAMLVYKSQPHSYKELPLRMAELGIVHRHELSGALHGLMRVRCFTQDDAHLFMRTENLKDEIKGIAALINEIYEHFGFKYHMELSTMPEKHIGTVEQWEAATGHLQDALEELGVKYIVNPGDGAFYGPKIDFHLEDSLGRTWQCGTIQLDMQMPERFELEYVGSDGEKHRPVILHRTAFGSIERFIGILTEHFAGAFPTWLAPVQVKILPITDRAAAYADQLKEKLEARGLRVETDHRNEKIGYKIREAQMEKVPYMLVLGDKEVEAGVVAVRSRSGGDLGVMDYEAFEALVAEENEKRLNK